MTSVILIGGPMNGQQITVENGYFSIVEDPYRPNDFVVNGSRPINPNYRRGTYRRSRFREDRFIWLGWDDNSIKHECTAIADQVVPEYRAPKTGGRYYDCTGHTAKRWQAAWDGACIALGGDPAEYRG